MVYVLDTNIFRKLLDHFPKKGKAFESKWGSSFCSEFSQEIAGIRLAWESW